ncbi:AbrB/MazE/SpoVT family DNA-binding domain-containing protein [Fictibacillus nanhaiensis]|uniref:AbrB/MazE/SpoVT family DNA-binding domain-containing protein n=1 Tax=Fictibacillus nanhaiensis TaxID=742169 RepID=UPI002E1C232B|nr:AbrB/MazE/SpoVT family DNA-binding domain-containing protein [Fictibacillus nanhaiensis]
MKVVDRLGRITVPISLREKYNIEISDEIEIFMEDDSIIIKKFNAVRPCMVTGKVSETNLEYAGGKLVLSSEGARTLLKELKSNPSLIS